MCLKFLQCTLQDATPDIPQPVRSPDGKLMSEHTRVTLLPLRLSLTHSCQLLMGPVDLKGFEPAPGVPGRNTEAKPRSFKFAQVPACAMVSHAPTLKPLRASRRTTECARGDTPYRVHVIEGQHVLVPQTSKQKLEAGTDDARLRGMPLVKAGLRQLKSM
jgi:hypothetical protein